MNSIDVPTIDCDCYRISRPLLPGKEIPLHSKQPDQPGPLHWESMIASIWNKPPVGIELPEVIRWPVPYRGRLLGAVISQWVEEDPKKQMGQQGQMVASQLTETALRTFTLEGFDDEVRTPFQSRLEFDWEAWRRRYPDHPPSEWIEAPDERPGLLRSECERLRLEGLPCSPSIVKWIRSRVAGVEGYVPARGILITSLIYVTPHPLEPVVLYDPNPEFLIDAQYEWTPDALMKRAILTINSNRRLFRKNLGALRINTERARTEHSRGLGGPPEFDYLEVAKQTAKAQGFIEELAFEGLNKTQYKDRVSAFATKIYNKVRIRRIGKGPSITPRKGWRDEFKLWIDEEVAKIKKRKTTRAR